MFKKELISLKINDNLLLQSILIYSNDMNCTEVWRHLRNLDFIGISFFYSIVTWTTSLIFIKDCDRKKEDTDDDPHFNDKLVRLSFVQ